MRAFVSRIANLLLVASLAVSCQHATDVASKGGTREQIEVPLLARNIPPHQSVEAIVEPHMVKMMCTPWNLAPQQYCKMESYVDGQFRRYELCEVTDTTVEMRNYADGELNSRSTFSLTFDQVGRVERFSSSEWEDVNEPPRVNDCVLGYEGDTNRLLFKSCEPELLCVAFEYDSSGRLAIERAGTGPCVGTDAVKTRKGVEAARGSVEAATKAWTGNYVYVYDEQGLVIERKLCNAALENCEILGSYSYDEKGRITHSNYHDAKTSDFQFNDEDQLVGVDLLFKSQHRERRYEYDDQGRMTHEFWTNRDASGVVEKQGRRDFFYECE